MPKTNSYLKKSDAWSTVLFADPLGTPLAKLLSRTSIHPNLVTLTSLLPALVCVYFFWLGDSISLLWGGLLFWFSWILDCTDGKLARLTGKYSTFGAKLDPVVDFVRKLLVLLALSLGVYHEYGLMWGVLTWAGVGFHYLVHVLAHRTPPRVGQGDIPKVPPERRVIRRVGQYYTAYDEQFFILFLAPCFAWLIPHLPTYVLYAASLAYAAVIIPVKIRKAGDKS